jgi:phosphoenolpyruvate synthase/pyruvate phosphate dikinase
MMDTVLNLGLNPRTLQALADQSKDERFANDAYRRFIMMFSDIVLELERRSFDAIFNEAKVAAGVKEDWKLSAPMLRAVVEKFKALVKRETGEDFPDDPMRQLELAILAVFNSWDNERARRYREIEKIPHDLGTAVNVQAMVFGNLGADSGTGVAFTRDASTGAREISGEYLINAQGEDVVAGIRTPSPISQLKRENSALYAQFDDICQKLERHYRDMMDVEFTFEHGKLYMLQCRVAKRAARAEVKIAVDMAKESLITRDEALQRVKPERLGRERREVAGGVLQHERAVIVRARERAVDLDRARHRRRRDVDVEHGRLSGRYDDAGSQLRRVVRGRLRHRVVRPRGARVIDVVGPGHDACAVRGAGGVGDGHPISVGGTQGHDPRVARGRGHAVDRDRAHDQARRDVDVEHRGAVRGDLDARP